MLTLYCNKSSAGPATGRASAPDGSCRGASTSRAAPGAPTALPAAGRLPAVSADRPLQWVVYRAALCSSWPSRWVARVSAARAAGCRGWYCMHQSQSRSADPGRVSAPLPRSGSGVLATNTRLALLQQLLPTLFMAEAYLFHCGLCLAVVPAMQEAPLTVPPARRPPRPLQPRPCCRRAAALPTARRGPSLAPARLQDV